MNGCLKIKRFNRLKSQILARICCKDVQEFDFARNLSDFGRKLRFWWKNSIFGAGNWYGYVLGLKNL